jgi:uncharacterized MAPEG superfamily protein
MSSHVSPKNKVDKDSNLPLFAAAIVAANAAHVPVKKIHALAASYLGLRALYNLAYIFVEDGESECGLGVG